MASNEHPQQDAPRPKQDPADPGHRSGEGSASIHHHMERDRERKNDDEAGRGLTGNRGEGYRPTRP
jgi:hypothetical protein